MFQVQLRRVVPFVFAASMIFVSDSGYSFSSRRVAGAPEPAPAPSEDANPGVLLSFVVRNGTDGLSQESTEYRSWLEEQARIFVKIRRGKVTATELADFGKACEESDGASPFCQHVDMVSSKGRAHSSKRHRGVKRNTARVRQLVARADLAGLRSIPERELRETIRMHGGAGKLDALIGRVLAEGTCEDSLLSLILGGKLEERFPDTSQQETSVRLYAKAAGCDGEQSFAARYRLALLHIWGGSCEAALPVLETLAESKTKDYRPRALFWTAECGTRLQKKELAAQAKAALTAEYPFSLHALLLRGETPRMPALPADSFIKFRSSRGRSFNDQVAAVEALLAGRELKLAREFLATLLTEAEGTEPEFQLYLAVLFNRAEDFLGKFRTLAPLLRDNPSLVSRASLALYYPKRELNTAVMQRTGLDELLVLSLIRQESAFNVRARSPAGAVGLMQVMPATARIVERSRRFNLYDPESNLKIGSKYFADLLKKFEGDAELALAAYNAGPKRVEEWVRRYPVAHRMLFLDLIPFKETREYVASIARNYYWYRLLYSEPTESEASEPQKRDKTFKSFDPAS